MENLLKEILAELQKLNRSVESSNQAGQAKVNEADALMKNLFASLPTNLIKGVNDVS